MSIRAQIYDLVEDYTTRGYERSVQGVRAYGVTKEGKTVSVLITDIPHEIYVDPAKESSGITDLYTELDQYLLQNPSPCRRTDCPNCTSRKRHREEDEEGETPKSRAYAPSYESCIRDRRSDKRALCSADQVMCRGFEIYEPEPRAFWRFGLTRSYYATPFKKFIESRGGDVYECCPDAVQSFVRLKNFAGFEWYEWPAQPIVKFDEFVQMTEWQGMAPIRELCFDIETIAKKYNNVESEAAKYPVGVVCVGDVKERGKITAYVLGDPIQAPEGCDTVRVFQSELELLRAVRDELLGGHVWSGWNTDKFDIPYIFKRGEYLGDANFRQFRDGRVIRFVDDEETGERSCYCPGIVFMDLCKVFKKTNEKPYEFKLGTVSAHLDLGEKDDMPYEQIHEHFYGTPAQRELLVKYCAKDVVLTMRIGKKIGAMTKLVAKCRVKRVRPQDELLRGASFVTARKVQEYLLKYAFLMLSRKVRYFSDGTRSAELSDQLSSVVGYREKVYNKKYPGGFVRDPIVGVYGGFTVGTLDFNSLYPSIMRTYNMCRSTQLRFPGELGGGDKEWVSTSSFAFAQEPEGIYPKIMRDMVDQRNAVRTQMAELLAKLVELEKVRDSLEGMMGRVALNETTIEDEIEDLRDRIAQLNALQNELKVVANSLYGQTGADVSILALKSAAQCTCQRGAELAQLACYIIDEDPRLLPEWTQEQRDEYFGRMRAYETSLSPEAHATFLAKRRHFADVMGLKVIYGDTDSLMINFSKSDGAETTLKWLTEVSNYINKESGILGTKGILKMSMEDVSCMILCARKMYVKLARSVEEGKLGKSKLKIAGMDNRAKSPYVRERLREMYEAVLVHGKDITRMYEDTVQSVALGQVPIKMLKHTSALNRDPTLYANESHAVCARQLMAAGLPVSVGDRVEYYRCLILNAGGTKAGAVVAAELVESEGYDLDYEAYALETIEAMKHLAPLIKDYARLSIIRHYHIRRGCYKLPPIQVASRMVGDKRKVMTAQAGPMDGFVKRTKTSGPAVRASRVQKARGREFDEMMLLPSEDDHAAE